MRLRLIAIMALTSLVLVACGGSFYAPAIESYNKAQQSALNAASSYLKYYQLATRVGDQEARLEWNEQATSAGYAATFARFYCSGVGHYAGLSDGFHIQSHFGVQLGALAVSPNGIFKSISSIGKLLRAPGAIPDPIDLLPELKPHAKPSTWPDAEKNKLRALMAQVPARVCNADIEFLASLRACEILGTECQRKSAQFSGQSEKRGLPSAVQEAIALLEPIVGLIEEYLRGMRIRQYVLQNEARVVQSFDLLFAQSTVAKELCVKQRFQYLYRNIPSETGRMAAYSKLVLASSSPLCSGVSDERLMPRQSEGRPSAVPGTDDLEVLPNHEREAATAFDRMGIVTSWAALRPAVHRFGTECAKAGLCDGGPAASDLKEMVAAHEERVKIEKLLEPFGIMSAIPSPKAVILDLEEVYAKGVLRMAKGDITIEELFALMQAFKARYEAAEKAFAALQALGAK